MSRIIGRTALPFAILAIVLLGACGDDDDASPSGDLTDEQVLHSRLEGEPQTIDPQRATDEASISMVRLLYSSLLRLDENQAVQPDLAEEVPTVDNGGISEDGLTYTFHLREGLMWDDGTPLVAQAFVDGANRLFDPGAANYYADFYRMIEGGVSAPDDRTVVYQLSRPSPVFTLLATLFPLFPVRQDLIDEHGDSWTEPGNLVSNGPFRLAEWTHNESIELARNEHWHGGDVPLERVTIDIIEDAQIAFLAYQEDELDVVSIGPEQLVQVRNDEGLQDEFQAYARLNTLGITFNFANEDLAKPGVRKALSAAMDREEYAETVREGAVLPAYSWMPPGMPGYDEDAGRDFEDAGDQAAGWLEEAGYPGGDGLELTILVPAITIPQLTAEWLKEQWEGKLGITANIEALETSAFVEALNAGDFDVTIVGWFADYPDPQNWMPNFATGSGLNSGGYSNPDFDALITEAETELSFDHRVELYQEAQRLMIDDVAVAPLYYGRRNILVKPWVHDLLPTPLEANQPGDAFFDRVFIDGRE